MKIPSVSRQLRIDLPPGQSAFLWGARQVGKTTYLRQHFPNSISYNLLQTDLYLELTKRPALMREWLHAKDDLRRCQPIIVDEVQKVPALLDEVHWLIEEQGLSFVLCGSSARKLKRGQANLLGGRAWRYEMLPLTSWELPELDLLRTLNHGLLPRHYLQDDASISLRSYVGDYLKEEVFAEGLTRNVPAFSRFFDAVGYSHGELTNYSSIARDCGVDAKTVREYYQILADTLVGRFVEPYVRRSNRQTITKAPKFYLFDVGVAGALTRTSLHEERGEAFGKAFEHLVFMELVAHSLYRSLHYPIRFWRTKSGLEVDFVLGDGEVAVEVKGSRRIERKDLRGLTAFSQAYAPKKLLLVCNERHERAVEGVRIIPWRIFFQKLWAGDIIS